MSQGDIWKQVYLSIGTHFKLCFWTVGFELRDCKCSSVRLNVELYIQMLVVFLLTDHFTSELWIRSIQCF